MTEPLKKMIGQITEKCLGWIGADEDGNVVLIDPIEGRAIGNHYALSHFAAAMIAGHHPGEAEYAQGIAVLRSVLARWGKDSGASDFHYEFNCMALCLIEEIFCERGDELELAERIRETVTNSSDSKHNTINWLPMRMYVNWRRLRWTGDKKFVEVIKNSQALIAKATNSDWLIEDHLPKGKSYNLQYNVATVALLNFFNIHCDPVDHLNEMVQALSGCIGPDGDVNYLGRGCNQMFAWGLWIYLLSVQGRFDERTAAIDYLGTRLSRALDSDNLLLDGRAGSERMYWWDYHYVSVYVAHLLLWLMLAEKESAQNQTSSVFSGEEKYADTGIDILRSDKSFSCIFSGRRGYWAEAGPVVAQIWTERRGPLVKGYFGPWRTDYGEKYATPVSVFNFFGLLKLKQGFTHPFLHRICKRLSLSEPHQRFDRAVSPCLCSVIQNSDGCLSFTFSPGNMGTCVINLPLLNKGAASDISVFADGARCDVRYVGTIATQYGEAYLYQTLPRMAKTWKVCIAL